MNQWISKSLHVADAKRGEKVQARHHRFWCYFWLNEKVARNFSANRVVSILPRTVDFRLPTLHWILLILTNNKSISDFNCRVGLLSCLLLQNVLTELAYGNAFSVLNNYLDASRRIVNWVMFPVTLWVLNTMSNCFYPKQQKKKTKTITA